jgi:hypothetical protein
LIKKRNIRASSSCIYALGISDLMMRNEMGFGIEEGNGGLGLKGICEGTNSRLCENDKVCDSK